jgi:PST family polysaccharide transporter
MVITASLGVYFLPKLSELKTNYEIRNEIFSVYKLIFPFLLVTTIIIYIFRVFIIHVLFTSAFTGMQDLFAFQLIGDILKIMGWVLGYLLLAKAMTKIYIVMEVVNFLLLILISYFLVNRYGSVGATLAFAVVYFIYFAVLCFVFRKLLTGKNTIS